MFKRKIDINNEQELFEKKSSKINQINLGLKTIAFEAGIKKKLSFHCSRHAFATNAITKGVSIKNVSKILGHSNIQMTLHYAKIEASLLDNAMDKFND
jgi:site-specific recombinase XerD